MSIPSWQRVSLGNLIDTQKGYAFKSGWFCATGRRIVKVSNFTEDSIDPSELTCIPESTAADYLKYQLHTGDVIVQTVGSWPNNPASVVGKCVRTSSEVAGSLLNQNAVRLSPSMRLDKQFLYYLLRGEDFKTYIVGTAQGAASQAAITLEAIRGYEFALPSLPIQQRVAGILSAYDELVENCQRRIKILESMTCALYREWFVYFRFPGHENHSRVASPLGEIPQGWEVKKLGGVFQTVLGGTPSRAKAEYWKNGTVAWINSGKVNDLRIAEPSELITELALKKSAAKLMPKGTTVLAITGATLGQVSYLEIETAANQSVVGIIDPTSRMSEWIYLSICERIEGIIKHASGGAQQHINKEVVNDVLIAMPETELAARFKTTVAPMFKDIAALIFQVNNLRRTRDLLLPRLLSGQIDVSTLSEHIAV